jgi:hypothetical protein
MIWIVAREVWLWDVEDVLPEEEEWRRSDTVTDVFSRSSKPAVGSVLIGVRTRGYPDDRVVVNAAGVSQKAQQVATRKDRIRVESIIYLEQTPLENILKRLPVILQRRFELVLGSSLEAQTARLSPQLGEEFLAAAAAAIPRLKSWLASIDARTAPVRGRQGNQLREERDAIALAVTLSGLDVPSDHLASLPDVGSALTSFFDPYFVSDLEDDLIAEDLRRFDSLGNLDLTSASIARFTDRNFKLTIMNVNRKPLEHVLGVDLVYFDEIVRSFTMVQYKRLTKYQTRDNDEVLERWRYTHRGELMKQLAMMDIEVHLPEFASDWRLSTSPFWFKFVRDDVFKANDPVVLKGMYVSSDFLRLAVDDASLMTGPRGGFEVTYANTKYIRRDTFVDLVRRGLVGTNSVGTARVLAIVADLSRTNEVLVAVKAPRNI